MSDRADTVRNLREDMDHMPGQIAAQRRMVKHTHAIFPAFDSLSLGFDHHAAIEYLKPVFDALNVPEEKRARFAGGVLAFGMTCVEADRERRSGEMTS